MTKIKLDPKGFFLWIHSYICMSWTMFQNVGCCVDNFTSQMLGHIVFQDKTFGTL